MVIRAAAAMIARLKKTQIITSEVSAMSRHDEDRGDLESKLENLPIG